jgi:hypothetical protein
LKWIALPGRGYGGQNRFRGKTFLQHTSSTTNRYGFPIE